jgi:ParB family transcriptional regulator, chromosome partitioning protein
MAFPPSAYTQRGGVATVAAANRTAWLAESDAPLDPDPAAAGAGEVLEVDDTETAEALEEVEEQRLAA